MKAITFVSRVLRAAVTRSRNICVDLCFSNFVFFAVEKKTLIEYFVICKTLSTLSYLLLLITFVIIVNHRRLRYTCTLLHTYPILNIVIWELGYTHCMKIT